MTAVAFSELPTLAQVAVVLAVMVVIVTVLLAMAWTDRP